MLPLRAKVDLGAMAIKGYSTFSKAPALLEIPIRLFSVISGYSFGGGVLPLCREAADWAKPQLTGEFIFQGIIFNSTL